jgi:hypothetical protein
MNKNLLAAFLIAILFATGGRVASAATLGDTQLREFFKWVKADANGLKFEFKLSRGFSVSENLPRQGPINFLHFGTALEIAYTNGALKLTPRSDAQGSYFEAQCFDAANFVATTPKGRYVLRPVSTPQGLALEILEAGGT